MPAVVFLQENPGATQRRARDESYFESYGSLGIHREMLADKVRPAEERQQCPYLTEAACLGNVYLQSGWLAMHTNCLLSSSCCPAGAD